MANALRKFCAARWPYLNSQRDYGSWTMVRPFEKQLASRSAADSPSGNDVYWMVSAWGAFRLYVLRSSRLSTFQSLPLTHAGAKTLCLRMIHPPLGTLDFCAKPELRLNCLRPHGHGSFFSNIIQPFTNPPFRTSCPADSSAERWNPSGSWLRSEDFR